MSCELRILPRRWADSRTAAVARLAVAAAAVGCLWLGVLPRLAARPAVARFIQRTEALGVDPSAKFYTELPSMRRQLDRVEAARRRSPQAFPLAPAAAR